MTAAEQGRTTPYAWADLGVWNLYFLSKVALAWMGALDVHWLPNLLLLAALLMPLRPRWARIVRQVVAVPAGVALYYQDTWWPPFNRLLAQPGIMDFSADYMWELAQRFINPAILLMLALLLLGYLLLRPWVRVTTLSVIGMLGIALSAIPLPGFLPSAGQQVAADSRSPSAKPANDDVLNAYLSGFYQQQAGLKTAFPAAAQTAPFDVIVLNICSMAWSDLEEVGLRSNPLLDEMNVIFDEFNSATAYSGPAAIRLLRASCGQTPHKQLFDSVPADCQLFSNLNQLGYKSELAMNHDGHFDNFIAELSAQGGLRAPPMNIAALPTALVAFDKSPLRRDGDVLGAWWKQRQAEPDQRVALFYNTISLHDGNRIVAADGRAAVADYRARANMVLNDMATFIRQLEQSGRKAVVVVVPEHGAALLGDRMQIPGMREIPSPSITHVPAGIKLIGMGPATAGGARHVAEPSSYLALSEFLSRLLASQTQAQPGGAPDWDALLQGLPVTPSVSENEGAKVIEYDGRPYLQLQGSSNWTQYPEGRR